MADEVRVWQVTEGDSLEEMQASCLDREERIEKWIMQDICVLEPDESGLLVIGEQVRTDFKKEIDLLCIAPNGDLVIVELKRDKTPREVTAQALDYASWVKDLGQARIEEIAAGYLNGKNLKEVFEETFDTDYPDVINGDHSIRIVASEVDESTERIIRYLSGEGININFVRFQMFRSADGRELLIRTFTVSPKEAEQNVIRSSNTKHTSSVKTLAMRMEECADDAERIFLGDRLNDAKQQTDKSKTALIYRFSDTIRYKVRARGTHVHVTQKGRFAEDQKFWAGHLSRTKVGCRQKSSHLAFTLYTKDDYEFFQATMEKAANNFQWLAVSKGAGDPSEDEESE